MDKVETKQRVDISRYLSDRPLAISRRQVMGMLGATVAAVALSEGVGAAPHQLAQLRAMAQETGPGARIVIANGQDLDELDPHYFKSIPSYYAVANLYDNFFAHEYTTQEDNGLFPVQDEEGNWTLVSWLADTWEVSEDQMTLTFTIRPGLTFSNGTPLTAQDVKATFDRGVTDTSVYSKLVFNLMTVMTADQIEAPDDSTVVITLEQPTVFALKMLATNICTIMSAAAIEENATVEDPTAHEYFSTNPLGSTAYTLSSWTPGVEWELAPNPDYWNPDVVMNGGVLNRTIPSPQERLNLLVNGDVDIAFDLLPNDLAGLRENPDVQLFDFVIPWPQYLGMNNRIAPFDNVDVRRAVSHAIPYQTIIDEVMFGFATECRSPVATGMPTSDYSYWNYDGGPAEAQEILDGLGISDFAFDLAVRIGFPTHEQIAVWIQSAMAEAGGTVNILRMTDAEYLEQFNQGALHSWIGEFYSWVNDPFYHLFWNFHSTATATNGAGYNNPRVDEIIDSGMYESDPATREALAAEAQQIVVDEAPWGLLYQINYVVAARSIVSGFNFNPDTAARYWYVGKE